jgi:hypothetical protein
MNVQLRPARGTAAGRSPHPPGSPGPEGTAPGLTRRCPTDDGLSLVLTGRTLGMDTAVCLSAGQASLQQLPNTLKAGTPRAITDPRRITYGKRPPAIDEHALARSSRYQIRRPGARNPRWPAACPWRSRRPWCCTSAAVRGHWCADDPVAYTKDPGGTNGRAG